MTETPPDGQLCDRLRNYSTHEMYSATRGARGARCTRPAKAQDKNGTWACGVHLGADKRAETNRQAAADRRRLYALARRQTANTKDTN